MTCIYGVEVNVTILVIALVSMFIVACLGFWIIVLRAELGQIKIESRSAHEFGTNTAAELRNLKVAHEQLKREYSLLQSSSLNPCYSKNAEGVKGLLTGMAVFNAAQEIIMRGSELTGQIMYKYQDRLLDLWHFTPVIDDAVLGCASKVVIYQGFEIDVAKLHKKYRTIFNNFNGDDITWDSDITRVNEEMQKRYNDLWNKLKKLNKRALVKEDVHGR